MKYIFKSLKNVLRMQVNIFRRYREKIYSAWIVYSKNIIYANRPIFRGQTYIINAGTCSIGCNSLIRSGHTHNPSGYYGGKFVLIVEAGAIVSIGNNFGISNSTIYCRQSITIGNGVLIGTDCKIYDTDFHSVHYEDRAARPEKFGKSIPVFIGDDVFIGTGSIILKGVTIGDRAVIGAGSVVSSAVPADELWAGRPARKIRQLT